MDLFTIEIHKLNPYVKIFKHFAMNLLKFDNKIDRRVQNKPK